MDDKTKELSGKKMNTIKISVYDPAMCCNTGVCGPAVDPELVRFANDVKWLESRGFLVERFNLSGNPQAFVENKKVKSILFEKGAEQLPVVLINGDIYSEKRYPTKEEIAKLFGITIKIRDEQDKEPKTFGCGGVGCC